MNTIRSLVIFLILATSCSVASAASKVEIDANVNAAISEFYTEARGGKELAGHSVGMLVFPKVLKAGIGVGGEYGEGALLVGGKTVAYYSTAAASVGIQLGVQERSQVILFMQPDALAKFRNSDGWKAGVDGSIALIKVGVGQVIDSETVKDPIIGFMFSNKGLMYNLTFEGSKISKIER